MIPLVALSLAGFIIVFNAYPLIKKLMIDPYYADLEKQNSEQENEGNDEFIKKEEENTIFTDTGRRKDIKKKHFNR